MVQQSIERSGEVDISERSALEAIAGGPRRLLAPDGLQVVGFETLDPLGVADIGPVLHRALDDLLELALDVGREGATGCPVFRLRGSPEDLLADVEVVAAFEAVMDGELDCERLGFLKRRHAELGSDLMLCLKGVSEIVVENLGSDRRIELFRLMFCRRQWMMFGNFGSDLS